MTLYFTNPEAIIEARRRKMQQMLERTFSGERVMSFQVDLSETDETYTLKALLPGLSTDDVNIQVNNGTLTIDGEYKNSETKEEVLVKEFPTGRFARSFELSDPIVTEKISATISNGVLTVLLPKSEEAKPRTIKIVAK